MLTFCFFVSLIGGDQQQQSEENSGVEFPGTSLEPFIGTSLNISDHEFHQVVVIVEVHSPSTGFAYKYKDTGRAFVGQCEWCN